MYTQSSYEFDYNRGLGVVPLTTAVSTATTAGTTAASGGILSGTLAAFGGPVGLAILGVTTAISLWLGRKRPKQKIATTQIVNEAEPLLVQNLAAWHQSPKTLADQQATLNNFDIVWSRVVTQCSDPEMGTPGEWCVDDRKPGGKWDWFARYRDPIASDPNVVANPTVVESLLPSQLQNVFNGEGGISPMLLLLGIGLVGFGVWSTTR